MAGGGGVGPLGGWVFLVGSRAACGGVGSGDDAGVFLSRVVADGVGSSAGCECFCFGFGSMAWGA